MPSTAVFFQTSDGVTIVGDWYEGTREGRVALLLHMMPATKESWRGFAEALLGAGFGGILAIDLRGHGESREGPKGLLNYRLFSDEEHQHTIRDIDAAIAWLQKEKAYPLAKIVLAGASIGANLAIIAASERSEIPAVAALSPGLDYHGVKIADAMKKISHAQRVFLVASEEDEYSFQSIQAFRAQGGQVTVRELRHADHGTNMFLRKPECMNEILGWLNEKK